MSITDFEKYCAQNVHAQEIAASRVGYLGGSDAAMVLKVGRKGLGALSNTDVKRLRVMLGFEPHANFGGNAATEAGHAFEDYCENLIQHTEREKFIKGKKYSNFTTMAHADYVSDKCHGLQVFELKCCQNVTTEQVAYKYAAQLQWYYLLGAFEVYLVHGTGTQAPFVVEGMPFVEYDAEMLGTMLHGLDLIDEYCDTLKQTEQNEWRSDCEVDGKLQSYLKQYADAKSREEQAAKDVQEVRSLIFEYMRENKCISAKSETVSVSYRKPSVARRLNMSKVLQLHPELQGYKQCWDSVTTREGITIKFKNIND